MTTVSVPDNGACVISMHRASIIGDDLAIRVSPRRMRF
jgi:hypothetical protein